MDYFKYTYMNIIYEYKGIFEEIKIFYLSVKTPYLHPVGKLLSIMYQPADEHPML